MTEEKTKLLRSLAIDRSASEAAPSTGRRSRWLLSAIAGVVVVAAIVAAVLVLPALRGPRGANSGAAQTPVASTPPPPPQTTARNDTGALAASGYVVARRKATVAAEITGKVVEVLIEEGMTVTEGQVVARLDSVLAESDLALARSRVEAADAAIGAISADLQDATRIYSRVQTLAQKNFATEADLTKAQARVGVLTAQLRQSESVRDDGAARRRAHRLGARQIQDSCAFQRCRDRPQRATGRNDLADVGRRFYADRHLHHRGHGFHRDRGGRQRGVHRAGRRRRHSVNAVLDAYPDWSIPASVIAIVPTANREKATVKVRIRFEQRDPRILPDMAVKVTFVRGANAGALPPKATASAN